MNERRHYRGGFVWPIILIGAGVVFLLNNLGLVGWNVWETLVRLWPVALIAVGLDILVGRRFPVGSVLLGLLLVGVLVMAVRGVIPQSVRGGATAVDRTETIDEDLQGFERATVDIRFGMGNLNVNALTEGSPKLVQGTVDLSRNERLNKNYHGSSGVGYITLESEGSWTVGPLVLSNQDKNWDLSLSRDIPLDLEINAGAGQSMLDLTGLNLRRFQLDGGVGQVTVKLPSSGRYDVRIEGGVGQVVLIVPQGLAAHVQVDGGLGGVNAQGDFRRQDTDYVTGDYNSATDRATVEVKGGVGEIVLKTLSE